jgi:hypothetical protein
LVFANDQELYDALFEKAERDERRRIEEDIEWVTPENPEAVREMLTNLPQG